MFKNIITIIFTKKRIIFGVLFLSFFLFFFLRNHYYIPSQLVLKTQSEEKSEGTIYWDTGVGFNDRESSSFKPYIKKEFEDKLHKIEISRLKENNEKASGSEVWIEKIVLDGNRDVPIEKLVIENQSFINENKKVALKNEETKIVIEEKFQDIKIVFYRHQWAGKVKILVDGEVSEVIDLYNAETKSEEYTLTNGVLKGIKENTIILPQLKIKGLKVEFSNEHSKLVSLTSKSEYGTVILSSAQTIPNGFMFNKINVKNVKFHWILFIVQIFLAIFITLIIKVLWEYIDVRLKMSNEKNIFKTLFANDRRYVFWGMFLIALIAYSFWLLGQWPAIMTVDSYHFTWREIKTFNFQNVTPWMYNIYVLALTQFYDSPLTVAVFQVGSMSLLTSFIFYYTYKQGANKWIVFICYLGILISIPIGIYNITIWKDIPYTIVMLLWAFYIYKIKNDYSKKKIKLYFNNTQLLILSILLVMLGNFRYNGIIYFAIIPVILFFYLQKKVYLKFLIITIILIIASNIFCSYIVKTDKQQLGEFFSRTYKIGPISAIYSSSNFYTPDYKKDKEVIDRWMGFDNIKKFYTPVSQVDTMQPFSEGWAKLSKEDSAYLHHLYYIRSFQNFHLFTADRLTMLLGTMGFSNNIFITTNELENSSDRSTWRPIEAYRFTSNPIILKLNSIQKIIIKASTSFRASQFYKIGIPLPIVIFNTFICTVILGIVLFLYKWFPASAIYSFLFLSNIPVLFIILSTCEWRYFYFLYVACFFILPLLSVEYIKGKI